MKYIKLIKAKDNYKVEEVGNGNWQIDVPGVGGGQILKVDKFSTLDAVSNYEVILWDKNSEMLPKKYAETFREAKAIVINHLKSQKSADKIKAKDNYGWEIPSFEAQDKLQLWIDVVGAEQAVWDLAKAMGNDELASNLAYIFRMNDFREGMSKESSVGFNAKPETDLEKEVVNVSNEIMSAASSIPMNGYSMGDEEEKKKFYQLTEDYVLPVLDKYKDRLQDKEFLDLLIEDLTDNNYHAAVKAIQDYVK